MSRDVLGGVAATLTGSSGSSAASSPSAATFTCTGVFTASLDSSQLQCLQAAISKDVGRKHLHCASILDGVEFQSRILVISGSIWPLDLLGS